MADIVGRSDRFVYLRVKVPRGAFDRLADLFGGDARLCQSLRIRWEHLLADIGAVERPSEADGSASRFQRM